MVGTEALEGGVEPGEQRAAGGAVAERTARQRARPAITTYSRGHAGGEHLAEHLLRGAVAVAVGGLDECAARVDEGGELGGGALRRRCSSPQVIVPSPIRDTSSPLDPTRRRRTR